MIPVWQSVLVRAARTYLQSLVAFLAVVGLGIEVGAIDDAVRLAPFAAKLILAAELAVAPTVVALLQNGLEVLRKLDVSHPELRG